ncbi:atherin-like [Panicum virgatum]|uniref:atherin-like n=1 Tax=Panicum virgatum TaxID=38727 RepID=UPI0019D5207C|nr:atherin-like [Panicum virgatum]
MPRQPLMRSRTEAATHWAAPAQPRSTGSQTVDNAQPQERPPPHPNESRPPRHPAASHRGGCCSRAPPHAGCARRRMPPREPLQPRPTACRPRKAPPLPHPAAPTPRPALAPRPTTARPPGGAAAAPRRAEAPGE